MQGNCPHCQSPLEIPLTGPYECPHCHARLEATPDLSSPEPLVVPSDPSPGEFLYSQPSPAPASGPAEVSATPTPAAAVWAFDPPARDLDAPCATHPANPASQVCERCGDFMCRLCTTQVEGRAYCPKCFDLLYHRGALAFTQRQFALPGITLALGITSLAAFLVCLLVFGFVLAIPSGIAGLAVGARALKSYQERPELSGRQLNQVGMWLSGLGLVLGLINGAVLIWISMRS